MTLDDIVLALVDVFAITHVPLIIGVAALGGITLKVFRGFRTLVR